MTTSTLTNYQWSFIPRLPDAQSWANRMIVTPIYRLSDITNETSKKINPDQFRGIVYFKTHHEQVQKINNISTSMLNKDLCCYFNSKQHLETIFKGCDEFTIPPSAINIISFFNIGYFIH